MGTSSDGASTKSISNIEMKQADQIQCEYSKGFTSAVIKIKSVNLSSNKILAV